MQIKLKSTPLLLFSFFILISPVVKTHAAQWVSSETNTPYASCVGNACVYLADKNNPVYAADNTKVIYTPTMPISAQAVVAQYSYFVALKDEGSVTIGDNFVFDSSAEYYKYVNPNIRYVVIGTMSQQNKVSVHIGNNVYLKGDTALDFERSYSELVIGNNAKIEAGRIGLVLGGELYNAALNKSTAFIGQGATMAGGDQIGLLLSQYNSEIVFDKNSRFALVSTSSNDAQTELNLIRVNGRQAVIRLVDTKLSINTVGGNQTGIFKYTNPANGDQPAQLNSAIPSGYSQAIIVDGAELDINLSRADAQKLSMINGNMGGVYNYQAVGAGSYLSINNMSVAPGSTPGASLASIRHSGNVKSDFMADIVNSDLSLLNAGINLTQTGQSSFVRGSMVTFNVDRSWLAGPVMNNSDMTLNLNLINQSRYEGDISNAKNGAINIMLDQDSSLVGAIQNNATTNMMVRNGSVWHNTGGDTVLSDVLVDNGRIDFSRATRAADVGKVLTVNNWTSNNATLAFQVGETSGGSRLVDRLVIDGGTTSGQTKFALVDLTNNIRRVVDTVDTNLILQGVNGGSFDRNQFGGEIRSGLHNYDILVFDNGTFIPILPTKKPTEEVEGYLKTVNNIVDGYQAPVVNTLGSFQNNFRQSDIDIQDSCRSYQTFGNVSYGNGKVGTGSGGSQDISRTQIQVGSDFYGRSLDSGCLIGGVILAHSSQSGDIFSKYYGRIGSNRTETNSAGIYTRYVHESNWYGSLSVMKYFGEIDINLNQQPQASTDSDFWAGSIEFGREVKLDDTLNVRPSVQAIYQHVRIDDVKGADNRLVYDNINTKFFRVGADLNSYSRMNDKIIKTTLMANLWYQPSGDAQINGYGRVTGGIIGDAKQSYGMTWGELGGAIQAQTGKNTFVDAKVNYRGKFDSDNGLYAVEFGFQHHW